jgi:hypothetical protein
MDLTNLLNGEELLDDQLYQTLFEEKRIHFSYFIDAAHIPLFSNDILILQLMR